MDNTDNMNNKEISNAVIRRLPRYYRYLGELLDLGIEKISSSELSERMNVTASQIRQDLNNFGEFGRQGYGYNIKYLYSEIGKILDLNQQHNMIIIGSGNLGQAIVNYENFEKRGFVVKGMFDNSKNVIGKKFRGIVVMDIAHIDTFMEEHVIHIATITIPKTHAKEVANLLVGYGVKAFWNFAHIDLDLPKDVIVENVHLSESLMRLSYLIGKSGMD